MFLFGSPNIDKMAAERDFDGLRSALDHRDPLVRLRAAEALAQLSEGSGWRYLLDAVRQGQTPGDQAVAAEMLAGLGHSRAIPALQEALPAARDEAREAIAEALSVLGGDENLDQVAVPTQETEHQPEAQSVMNALMGSMIEGGHNLENVTRPELTSMDTEGRTAEQHLNAAVELRESEMQERALVEIGMVLWLSPNWGYAWYLRGVLMEELERAAEAVLAYRRALHLDSSLVDAQSALDELDERVTIFDARPESLLSDLNDNNYHRRRDAIAVLAQLPPNIRPDHLIDLLLKTLQADDEREVLHAAFEALAQLKDPRAVQPLLEFETSSWLLRFAIIQALSAMGDVDALVSRLRAEMNDMHARSSLFSGQKDPLLELEYGLLPEIGILALEQANHLEDLVSQAESNVWVEVEEEESEEWQAEEQSSQTEESSTDDLYLEDEEDVPDSFDPGEDLLSYVDETSLMVVVALERLAARSLREQPSDLLRRLAAVPDLTLLDPENEQESPVVVYDLSALRRKAQEEYLLKK